MLLNSKDLKKQNAALYENNKEFIKNIKKMDRKLISMAQILGEITGDGGTSGPTGAEQINDTTFKYPIVYDMNNLSVNGNYTLSMLDNKLGNGFLTIDDWKTNINLTTAVTETKEGILQFEVKPNDTTLRITDVNATVFDPKDSKVYKSLLQQSRWSIGPTISTGIMVNPLNGNGGVYIGIGLGLTYKTKLKDIKKLF
jgi:hypothetical protein